MYKFFVFLLMLSFSLFGSGQVKQNRHYSDDLYYSGSEPKDSLPKIDRLAGMDIDQLNYYKQKATNRRNAGVLLTLAGSLAMMVGYIAAQETEPYFLIGMVLQSGTGKSEMYPSEIAFLAGCASTFAGIPLWITGGKRKRDAEIVIMKLKLNTNSSGTVGIGMTFRF
jgi:hypothetical protein